MKKKHDTEFDEFIAYLKEEMADEERKLRKRLYQPIELGKDLSYYLKRLPKTKLDDLRKRLDLRRASNLKKDELAEVLSGEIKRKTDYILKNISEGEYNLFKEILNRGGTLDGFPEEMEDLTGLQRWGIAFSGVKENAKEVVIIPDELIMPFKRCMKDKILLSKVDELHRVWRIAAGYLYYCGAVDILYLMKMLEKYIKNVSSNEVISYLFNNSGTDRDIYFYNGYFCHWMLNEADRVIKEQKQRRDLEYAEIPIDMLLKASGEDFMESDENIRKLEDFFVNKIKMNKIDSIDLAAACIEFIRNDYGFGDIISYLSEIITFPGLKEAQEFTSLFQNVYNGIRKWVLKGHTSDELFEMEKKFLQPLPSKGKKKIGRNELCPCGSGKKYKHCCGRGV